jgi:hypothetical protein
MQDSQQFGTVLRLLSCVLALSIFSACRSVPTALAPLAQPAPPAPSANLDAPRFPEEPTRSRMIDQLQPGKALRIINEFGEVRVRFGGFEHALEATAVAQAPIGAAIPVMRYDAALGEIKTALPNSDAQIAGQRIDVTVFVPEQHALSVQSLQGLIEVRGLRADLQARSESGAIFVRGVSGAIDLQTGSGVIEAAIFETPVNRPQRLETRTGSISVSFAPDYSALVTLASSGLFATEYSLSVEPLPGQEPNKAATALIGAAAAGPMHPNPITISSKRGDIRLFRRAAFIEPDSP